MADLQKLCLPPLFTHSLDYDNNLTLYECYGAILNYLNNVLLKDLNDLKRAVEEIIVVNMQQEEKITTNTSNIASINTMIAEINTTITQIQTNILGIQTNLDSINQRITRLETELLGVNSIVDEIIGFNDVDVWRD